MAAGSGRHVGHNRAPSMLVPMLSRFPLAASLFLLSALGMTEGARLERSWALGGQFSAASRVRMRLEVYLQAKQEGRNTVGFGKLPMLRLRGGCQPAATNFEEVGKAFVQHYYNMYDTNRAGLQNLYQDVSMMTFEGEQFQGAQAISQKLESLPFQNGGPFRQSFVLGAVYICGLGALNSAGNNYNPGHTY